MPRDMGLHLAIDASNIRQGGGVTHLAQFLHAAEPQAFGFDRVSVWTGAATQASLPDRRWLLRCTGAWMEAPLPRRAAHQQWLLGKEIERAGCDLLFSPGGTLPGRCRLPAVTMSQNMLPFEPNEAARFGSLSQARLKMRLLRTAQASSFRRSAGVIFLTEYARNAVQHAIGAALAATALIPHGIEPRFFSEPRPARTLAELSPERPLRLLYVSIVMPYKHQHAVARAAAQLRAQGLPLEVRFVGESSGLYGRDFRRLLDELDPGEHFLKWQGSAPFRDLHRLYQEADMFVFASSCENLPNILVEAMAAGLPIASSCRGPMPEVLGQAGLFFDPDRIDSIAGTLRALAEDSAQRQQLAVLAYRRAQAFSWKRCADETLSFLQEVARTRAQHHV